MSRICLLGTVLLAIAGCGLIPRVEHEPVIYNPFPQLSRVAVAPFFNLSDEATVNGLQFAKAYYAELQTFPGFEVVPPTVVGEAILQHQIHLDSPADVRRLAEVLGVDVVVVGAVTDYSPYYPPRVGLKAEWFAANTCLHEIPPGFGLPWGTPEEEFIPESLVFEAEFAQAKARIAAQSPHQHAGASGAMPEAAPGELPPPLDADSLSGPGRQGDPSPTLAAGAIGMTAPETAHYPTEMDSAGGTTTMTGASGPHECQPYEGAVMSHTQIFQGDDAQLTEALSTYAYFRDDLRQGGWEAVLRRDDQFIRFCCRLHISEMLSARGGAEKTRVAW